MKIIRLSWKESLLYRFIPHYRAKFQRRLLLATASSAEDVQLLHADGAILLQASFQPKEPEDSR